MRILLIALIAVSTCLGAEMVEEETIKHAGTAFRVVRVPAAKFSLVWKDAEGAPYRTFDNVQSSYAAAGKTVKFITNAGIFEPGGIPSGLHIEDGKLLRPVNVADAPGNFFLKPNGVLSFGRGPLAGPFIGTTDEWLARTKNSPGNEIWALQSGPMLLIDGKRHPAFQEGSPNQLLRNGVGLDAQGRFIFAITAKGHYVNFWDFAGLFLHLGCRNALFLDGDISQMAVNPAAPVPSNRFGAMLVVAE